jgi:hypothetical protein
MQVDWYTRSVLTVIALSLVALVLQNMQLLPIAKADQAHASGKTLQSQMRVPAKALTPDGSVKVRLQDQLGDKILDVNVVRVSGTEVREGLPVRPFEHSMNVNVEELGGYQVYGSLPVQMK